MDRILKACCALSVIGNIYLTAPFAQALTTLAAPEHNRSLDFTPLSPVMRIYVLQFCQRISPRSELIIGPYYANIHFDDIGDTDAPGFLVGYRRYLRGNLHVEYQLIPQWDHFYEENEDKTYPLGFDLWNELRLGYTWDFKMANLPAFINVQWPFGFALYSDDSAKPESFKKKAEEDPYFYFPPIFFVGVRF